MRTRNALEPHLGRDRRDGMSGRHGQTARRGAGKLQKWNGTSWVNVSTAATSPLAQRNLSVGEKIRWVPPAGVSGDRAAFKVKARDGALNSAVTAQVIVNLALA